MDCARIALKSIILTISMSDHLSDNLNVLVGEW
jgi:hypothetical protein